MVMPQHFDEAKHIWKTFVPKSGQAETVQGELLRGQESGSGLTK